MGPTKRCNKLMWNYFFSIIFEVMQNSVIMPWITLMPYLPSWSSVLGTHDMRWPFWDLTTIACRFNITLTMFCDTNELTLTIILNWNILLHFIIWHNPVIAITVTYRNCFNHVIKTFPLPSCWIWATISCTPEQTLPLLHLNMESTDYFVFF
jgi:hypothetical protein